MGDDYRGCHALDPGTLLIARTIVRMTSIRSPLQAQVVQWQVSPGDAVRVGDLLVVLEAMKMEHEVLSTAAGCVRECLFAVWERWWGREKCL